MIWVGVGTVSGQLRSSQEVREVTPAEKLVRIMVPRVEISDAALADALEFLRIRSEDLDSTVAEDRPGRGLNFILKDPGGDLSEKGITLTLTRVPLKTVLEYVTRFAGVSYRVDAHAVVIGKPEDLGGDRGMMISGRVGGEGRMVFERLRDVRLPAVSIGGASIEEVIQYFRAVSVPGSRGEDGREGVVGKGLNFVFKNPEEEVPRISLNLKDVPLGTALRYACELGGLVYTVHPNAVVIGRADDLVPRPADPGAHAYGRSGVRPGWRGTCGEIARPRDPAGRIEIGDSRGCLGPGAGGGGERGAGGWWGGTERDQHRELGAGQQAADHLEPDGYAGVGIDDLYLRADGDGVSGGASGGDGGLAASAPGYGAEKGGGAGFRSPRGAGMGRGA